MQTSGLSIDGARATIAMSTKLAQPSRRILRDLPVINLNSLKSLFKNLTTSTPEHLGADESTYLAEELFADSGVGALISESWVDERSEWKWIKDGMVQALEASSRFYDIEQGAIKLVLSIEGGPRSKLCGDYGLIVLPLSFLTDLRNLVGKLMRCEPLSTKLGLPVATVVGTEQQIRAREIPEFPPIEDFPEIIDERNRLFLGASLTIMFHELLHIRHGHIAALEQLNAIPDFLRTRRTLEYDADNGATFEIMRLFKQLDGPKMFPGFVPEVERLRYGALCICLAYLKTSSSALDPLTWLSGSSIYPPAQVRSMAATGGIFANLTKNDPTLFDRVFEDIIETASTSVFIADLAMRGAMPPPEDLENVVWNMVSAHEEYDAYSRARWARIIPELEPHLWGASSLSPASRDPE